MILNTKQRTICMYTSIFFVWKVYKCIIYYICILYILIWYAYMTWVQMFAACILDVQFWIHYLRWDKYLERSDELISATRSSGKPTMANLLNDAEQCIEQLPVLLKGHLELQVFFRCAMGIYHGTMWFVGILCKKDITTKRNEDPVHCVIRLSYLVCGRTI